MKINLFKIVFFKELFNSITKQIYRTTTCRKLTKYFRRDENLYLFPVINSCPKNCKF